MTQEFLRRADRVVSFLADRAAQLEARGRERRDDREAFGRQCDRLSGLSQVNWFRNQCLLHGADIRGRSRGFSVLL